MKVDKDTSKNTIIEIGYEFDESIKKLEEEKAEETKVWEDKEYALEIAHKT